MALAGHNRLHQLIPNLQHSTLQYMRTVAWALARYRDEIFNYIKVHTHYGPIGDLIHNLKVFRFRLQKRSGAGYSEKYDPHDDVIPSYLNAALKRTKDLYKINNHLIDSAPTILFVSTYLPRFDKTAADFRLFNILNILLANKCKIEYIYHANTQCDASYEKALKGDINFTHLPLNQQDYNKIIAEKTPEYLWITNIWGINYITFMAQLSESLKKRCPSLKLIIDTMDFHFKEFLRKYEWTKNQDDLTRANEFLRNEEILYEAADTVIVISDKEKRDIQSTIMGAREIEIVPIFLEIFHSTRPYSKRRNICFVGHFGNKHNVDAVKYFLENIFQLILARNPRVEFHVLGYLSEKYRKVFQSPNVKVIGSLKNLQEALTHYKLFVCPMPYGAGMKGKIGDAAAAGVPIVTTSIGAEGFPVRDGEECFISDSPIEFAEKCNQCLADPVVWHNFSIKSRLMIAENFSPDVVAGKLAKVLSSDSSSLPRLPCLPR